VGSTDYFHPYHAGAIDYTNVPRLAGSTSKPFLYGLALERGLITPPTIFADLPPGASGLTNADKIYLGPLLPRAALANSRVVPAVHLLEHLGLHSSAKAGAWHKDQLFLYDRPCHTSPLI
jgi:penicillin-binding protein 1C